MAADINFYGLLYEFHRTSTNGADILITIEKKWYEGEVKQRALGRAPVIKRENKDHIFGTSCELYAECLVDGEYADMYTSDPYEFRVSVYKDETLLWQGFVSPELYSEPDAAPPYDVQITATDGLGELKNSIYEERGAASILSHIMGLIGQYPIYVISGLRYVDSTGAISQDHDILNVSIDFDHEKGNSKYDVLQNLLTSLNANITQLNGRYVIFRETDFINKATDEGVEAFDVNGEKVYISIASFGSMTSHQWWPIGQLSTVVEPAKNSLLLQAPNHYKDNVLDFSQWSILNSAEYDATEDAYILPDEGSYITQALDFDNEVGYRLGLRIRARNVGDSEEDQNIGLMIKVNARTYSAPEGRDFWLVKSEVSTGNARTDYLWRGQEDYFEEALNMPSDADTASDAQNVDIVIPLYDHSQNGLSYIFASSLSIKIFNPAGIHDIYVYDVSLVKYEQSEGYEAKVVINNAAREAESDIDLSMSSASFAPAAGNMFMTGLPMQADGLLIEQWQIPGSAAKEYLSAMSYDYARAVALPKMKYSGVLNVPDTASILPMLFLRDGTFYFPKTYTYDLYNDEIQVELISISAADVSLSSVVISQYAESSGNMGGVTTGGGGGGSVVSLPRDKVMSDTSDNAVENKVIKKYVDDLRDQLLGLWHLDDDGNIVTDKQVVIKNNLIVEKDTSSGDDGQDTPSAGLDEEQLQDYLDLHKYVTESRVQEMIDEVAAGDVDLTNYYTKGEVDAKIPSLDGYATEKWVTNKNYLSSITKTMVDSVLGSTTAGNANRFLMSTGSTSVWAAISKSMVTDALGYTPLSTGGGTITSNANTILTLKGGASNSYSVAYFMNGDTYRGYVGWSASNGFGLYHSEQNANLGIKDDGTPHYNGNTLYHTGNFNPANYLPLSGGTMVTGAGIYSHLDSEYGAIGFNADHNAFGSPNVPTKIRSSVDPVYLNHLGEYTLIHSGNIGSQLVKGLAKSVTIWGQSFDGTGNVSGNLSLGGGKKIYWYGDSTNYCIGTSYTVIKTAPNIDYYGYGGHRFITAGKEVLRINNSGNVTIGNSDLASTNYRLYVEGGAFLTEATQGRFYARISSASVQLGNISSKYTGGYNTGLTHGTDGTASGYLIGAYKEGSTVQWIYIDGTSSSSTMVIKDGNVGVGIKPEYKLDVNGALGMGGIEILDKKSNALYIGYGSANKSGLPTYLWGKGINFINSGGQTRMFITDDGAVTMSSTLSVGGNCYLSGMSMIYQSDNAYRLTSYTSENYARIYNIKEDGSSYGSMYIGQNSTGAIVIKDGSYVGVGATPSGNYKLEINGQIFTNSTLFTPAIYGGPVSSLKWRLINDVSSNGLWLQAALADLSSNKGKMYLSGINGVNLTELNLYADNTKASKVTLSVSLTTPVISATGGLDIVANNSGAGARLYLTTNVFRPWGDDTKLIDLGASNIQWRNVYAVGATFSGDVNINGNLVVGGDIAAA